MLLKIILFILCLNFTHGAFAVPGGLSLALPSVLSAEEQQQIQDLLAERTLVLHSQVLDGVGDLEHVNNVIKGLNLPAHRFVIFLLIGPRVPEHVLSEMIAALTERGIRVVREEKSSTKVMWWGGEQNYLRTVAAKVREKSSDIDLANLVFLGVSCAPEGITIPEFLPSFKTLKSVCPAGQAITQVEPPEEFTTGFSGALWTGEISQRARRFELTEEAVKVLVGDHETRIDDFNVNVGYFRDENAKKDWIYTQLLIAKKIGPKQNTLFVGPLPVDQDEISRFVFEQGYASVEFVDKAGSIKCIGKGFPVVRFVAQRLLDDDYFSLLTHEPESIGGSGDSSYNRTLMGRLPYFDMKKFWVKQGAFLRAQELGFSELAQWLTLKEWEPVQLSHDDFGNSAITLRPHREWLITDAVAAAGYAVEHHDKIIEQWNLLRQFFIDNASLEKELVNYVRQAIEKSVSETYV